MPTPSRPLRLAIATAVLLPALAAQAGPSGDAAAGPLETATGEHLSTGAATSMRRADRDSFSQPLPGLDEKRKFDAVLGRSLFEKLWVSSPASTKASDGLGPLFNARACSGCHPRDGRGDAPGLAGKSPTGSLILHLSTPPRTEAERAALAAGAVASLPHPRLGRQLQQRAVPGLAAEGELRVAYTDVAVPLAGGETVTLRKPAYTIAGAKLAPTDPPVLISPRLAPGLVGLGLLEQVPAADILALADPDDADGDGISGKASRVRDPATGKPALGRYGWKASLPSVRAQSADAFSGDIGISTTLYPAPAGDCTRQQTDCLAMPSGVQPRLGAVEAPDKVLDLVAFYVANLAVPARRDVDDPAVLAGRDRFFAAGCASCHHAGFVTRADAPQPAHRGLTIRPYTDLLLHDMGPGLADGRPVGNASGSEWRTAPLWGIGLAKTVNPGTGFLHDGRARTLLEAILWHDGEAARARDAVIAMQPSDRAALIRFLESL